MVVDSNLQASIVLIFAADYSVNFIEGYYCKNNGKYYELYDEENNEIEDREKCQKCDDACFTLYYH